MTFLAIDIGNTRLKWALYEAPVPGRDPVAHGASFLETIEQLGEGGDWTRLPVPASVLGSCVAGDAIRRRTAELVHELWEKPCSWVVPNGGEAGVVNGYDHPARLGADSCPCSTLSRLLTPSGVPPAAVER